MSTSDPPRSMEEVVQQSEEAIKDAIDATGKLVVEEAMRVTDARPQLLKNKKRISEDTVRRMTIIGSPIEEIALVLDCGVGTLYRRFGKVIERARAFRNTSVRRKQYKVAVVDGDSNMLRWLGIQWLGQSNSVQVTGAGGGPIEVHHEHDFTNLTRQQLLEQLDANRHKLIAIDEQLAPLLAAEESGKAVDSQELIDGGAGSARPGTTDSGSADGPPQLHSGEPA
jgi:hypothetical protein